MTNLLFDLNPIIVLPELAVAVGLNESILLQQIHYWTKINEKKKINFYDGNYWTYNTIEKWNEQFPWWSKSTMKRIIKSLEESELIITGSYNKKSGDRTKWYRINYEKLKFILPLDQNEHMIPLVQNEPMERVNLTPALPETNAETNNEPKGSYIIKKTINKKTNKTAEKKEENIQKKKEVPNIPELKKTLSQYPEILDDMREFAKDDSELYRLLFEHACFREKVASAKYKCLTKRAMNGNIKRLKTCEDKQHMYDSIERALENGNFGIYPISRFKTFEQKRKEENSKRYDHNYTDEEREEMF